MPIFVDSEESLCKPSHWDNPYYFPYYKAIQKIIKKNRIIERREEYEKVFKSKVRVVGLDYEFNQIPVDAFDIFNSPHFFRYKKENIDLFGYPKYECYKPLKDFVEFVGQNDDESYSVKKEDILIEEIYINGKEERFSIKIRMADKDDVVYNLRYVIRAREISPYYLFAFLKSGFLRDYCLNNFMAEKNEFEDYYYDLQIDVTQLPLLLSSSIDNNYFKRKYEFEQFEKTGIQRKVERANCSGFFNRDAREIMIKDMNELRCCFNAKAYKAAIILSGSILESFLID